MEGKKSWNFRGTRHCPGHPSEHTGEKGSSPSVSLTALPSSPRYTNTRVSIIHKPCSPGTPTG